MRQKTVPDLVGQGIKLLFVGINPGLWTAATQTHFSHPANRFYPALYKAGITEYEMDRKAGLSDSDREYLIKRGIGISNIVTRTTARADELNLDELRSGAASLEEKIAALKPTVVAIAGVTAYRRAFKKPKAKLGKQPDPLGSAELWVVPNPSGLNAHENVDSLAEKYRHPAEAAGLL